MNAQARQWFCIDKQCGGLLGYEKLCIATGKAMTGTRRKVLAQISRAGHGMGIDKQSLSMQRG